MNKFFQTILNFFAPKPQASNFGLIHQDPRDTDWIASAETGIPYKENLASGDWTPYLPEHILQRYINGLDTNACPCFMLANLIKKQGNRMLATGEIPQDAINKLTNLGFIVNGKFSISARFIALVSKNDPQKGNTFVNVLDAVREHKDGSGFGLVPEVVCPMGNSVKDFYTPAPQEAINYGKSFLDFFTIKYDFVYSGQCAPNIDSLKYYLKQVPLGIASPVCGGWSQDLVVKACPVCLSQHATSIFAITDVINDYDSENTKTLKLALNYPITSVLRVVLELKQASPTLPSPIPVSHQFLVNMQLGDNNSEVGLLQDKLRTLNDKNGNPYFPHNVALTPQTGKNSYGPITKNAVAKFQTEHGINPSEPGRYCFEITREALNRLI